MTLSTHPEDRREMVRALSERLQTPAVYMRTPNYAFQIGSLTVNRDGCIASEDEALLESLRPMLIERGWLDSEPEEQPATTAEENSEAEGTAGEVHSDAEGDPKGACDEQIVAEDDPDDLPVEQVVITTPLTDWTVPQLTNLLRTLYARQYLLNRMMQGETLYIEEPVVVEITDNPPTDAADFKARVQRAVEDGCVRGIVFEGGKLGFSTPYCAEDPTRWMTYQKLLDGILHSARYAKRISIRPQVTPENEKYYANSWLMRMGFGGSEHKELRHTLMRHLNGYAAFKSEADMQAHREKYAQMRRDFRDVSE